MRRFIPTVAPRFGRYACAGYILADAPEKERTHWLSQYNAAGQFPSTRVVYSGCPGHANSSESSDGLEQYCIERKKGPPRKFDFNEEGVAHYGLLTDMLQDLKNLGISEADFASLFNSAEFFLRTWERAMRLADLRNRRSRISLHTFPFCNGPARNKRWLCLRWV